MDLIKFLSLLILKRNSTENNILYLAWQGNEKAPLGTEDAYETAIYQALDWNNKKSSASTSSLVPNPHKIMQAKVTSTKAGYSQDLW